MNRLRFAPFSFILAFLLLPGCDTVDDSGNTIVVTLANNSADPIHLFSQEESFSPGNRVAAGESRSVIVNTTGDGLLGPYRFSAGLNGTVTATVSCTRTDADVLDSDTYRVAFGNDGVLLCIDW